MNFARENFIAVVYLTLGPMILTHVDYHKVQSIFWFEKSEMDATLSFLIPGSLLVAFGATTLICLVMVFRAPDPAKKERLSGVMMNNHLVSLMMAVMLTVNSYWTLLTCHPLSVLLVYESLCVLFNVVTFLRSSQQQKTKTG